jgi:hypothetical protein
MASSELRRVRSELAVPPADALRTRGSRLLVGLRYTGPSHGCLEYCRPVLGVFRRISLLLLSHDLHQLRANLVRRLTG